MWAARGPAVVGLGLARSAFCRLATGNKWNKFSPLRGYIRTAAATPILLKGKKSEGIVRRFGISAIHSSQSTTPNTSPSTTAPPPPNSDHTSSHPPPPPPPRRKPLYIRIPIFLTLTTLFFTLGFTMTGTPALDTASAYLHPPTDAETMTMFTPDNDFHQEIEDYIFSHPLILSLTSDPKYTPSRPHLKIPPSMRHQNLTGGTLLGADKIAVPPLQFSTSDGSTFTSVQYLGSALCGHPGIVHGGLLATLLDEGLARCCFPALPNKVGVTANLKIDYRKPVMAGQYVVLRAETTKVEGRKAWVRGWLETLPGHEEWEGDEEKVVNGNGNGHVVNGSANGEKKEKTKPVVLVEAEALFIEPRQAATMARVYSTT